MRRFTACIATLLVVLLTISAPLLLMPQRAHAIPAAIIADISFPSSIGSFLKETLIAITSALSAEADTGNWIKEYVLDPIAWTLADLLLEELMTSTVNWVGGYNGGGFSLSVQSLEDYLLDMKDAVAFAFFDELGTHIMDASYDSSPFATAILSSITLNYLDNSRAGFWEAARCTLQDYAPDPYAFVMGDFSQGGWSSWFALTTQDQNNPYSLYHLMQSETYARMAAAEATQMAQLDWGQGFMSWCGGTISDDDFTDLARGHAESCFGSDGLPGVVRTPGSAIHDQLQKSFGSSIDRLVNVDELNEFIGALITAVFRRVTTEEGVFRTDPRSPPIFSPIATTTPPAGTYRLGVIAFNGTVTKDPDLLIYAFGAVVTLTAIADAGYTFTGWSGDTVTIPDPAHPEIATITMNSNKNVTANFELPSSYILVVSAENGFVTKSPDLISYPSGQEVGLTAVADPGYMFISWTGNVTSATNNPTTILMNANEVVTAHFAPLPLGTYTLGISAVGLGSVTKNPNLPSYASGATVTLTAVPSAGYIFSSWSGPVTIPDPAHPEIGEITMGGNLNVTANFTSTLPLRYTLTVQGSPDSTVLRNPHELDYAAGSSVQITANPFGGWQFVSWGGDAAGFSTNPAFITMDSNKIVTVTFRFIGF